MDERYTEIRRRVVRRLRRRALFWLHLIAYVLITLQSMNEWRRLDHIFVLWIGVIFVHFIYAFEVWQRMVDRMVQRELGKSGAAEIKRKNEQVALDEDGELVPLDALTDIEDEAVRTAHHERR